MLSIIIPTLNEEEYLPLLLESIKKQDFTDYEVIVADANSKDKTIEIAKNYGCKIISGGLPAKGRNEGAKVAKSDLFLFIDADMFFPSSGFLTELIKEFKKRELEVAGFASYPVTDCFTSNNIPKSKRIDRECYRIYNFWAKISQKILPYAGGVILAKKEIHQKIGGFDEEMKLAEDHTYARKAAKLGKFGFLSISPILISSRRFERDGRLKTYLKYVLAGVYMIFRGPIKSDIFKYKFNHYKNHLKINNKIIK
jgi:glycosyltransferase involved in cell wall biosynthesis